MSCVERSGVCGAGPQPCGQVHRFVVPDGSIDLGATDLRRSNRPGHNLAVSRPHRLSLETPIVSRTAGRIAEFATELLEASLAQVPGAEKLPPGHFATDVTPAIVAVAGCVLSAIDEQRGLDADEVAALIVPVIERQAEERIPLRISLRAFFGGARRMWEQLRDEARPEDLDDVLDFLGLLLDLFEQVNISMAETHAAVAQSLFSAEREARRDLSSALLEGKSADEHAIRAGIQLEDVYDLLSIRVPASTREDNAVTQRRMRIAREMLDDLSGMSPLYTFDGVTGHVLLPSNAEAGDSPRYARVATQLTSSLELPVVVIELHDVPRADLPGAVAYIDELAEVARLLSKPAGAYILDDLMLEHQLTRPGPSRDRLVGRLDPLLEHPHLLEALRAHIRYGGDRKRAADAIHLHPNSLSYRLRRVAELTGYDTSTPDGSRLLAAALLIHDAHPSSHRSRP